jgi:hypothetical protein
LSPNGCLVISTFPFIFVTNSWNHVPVHWLRAVH